MSEPAAGVHRGRVIVVSDRVAAGEREDRSGSVLAAAMGNHDIAVDAVVVVPDEVGEISEALTDAARAGVDVVCTTGGTGFSPRDVTPEATRTVIEREAPGIAEAIRRASDVDGRGFGLRSRGMAGIIGSSIVVNLPGSTSGVLEGWNVIADHIPHLVKVLAGKDPH